MLLASMLIYFTSDFFYERLAGQPNILSLLSELAFVERGWWERIVGAPIILLEESVWSLYVEFKFYIIVGVIYYLLGRRFLVPLLVFFIYSL